MSNTTSQPNPTFVGKYFDDTKSFLEYFEFYDDDNQLSSEEASKSMIKLCQSEGKSVGVQSPQYLQNQLDGVEKELVMIMIIHDYAKRIKGFVVLNEKNDNTVYLSLICSKVKGGGSYLLKQVTRVFTNDYKKYKKIELSAVKGVGQVYEKIAGYKYVEIDPDNYISMELDLEELRNKTIDEGNEGNIDQNTDMEYYVTKKGRRTSITGPLTEDNRRTKLKSQDKMMTPSGKTVYGNTGGKRKKTRKNGFKKRRQTRRRR